MGDNQLRARVSDQLSKEVESIIKDINDNVPGAGATVSSVVRYALEEYVKNYKEKFSYPPSNK